MDILKIYKQVKRKDMEKYFKILFFTLYFLIFNSCCSTKITDFDKKYWNKEIYGEEPFLKEITSPKKINLSSFFNKSGYIFPAVVSAQEEVKSFTPSKIEIERAESILLKKNTSLAKKYKNRYRQYEGVYNENRKVVHVNFIKIKEHCRNESKEGYLLDKWFIVELRNKRTFNDIVVPMWISLD